MVVMEAYLPPTICARSAWSRVRVSAMKARVEEERDCGADNRDCMVWSIVLPVKNIKEQVWIRWTTERAKKGTISFAVCAAYSSCYTSSAGISPLSLSNGSITVRPSPRGR
jgi:hypothetical protein